MWGRASQCYKPDTTQCDRNLQAKKFLQRTGSCARHMSCGDRVSQRIKPDTMQCDRDLQSNEPGVAWDTYLVVRSVCHNIISRKQHIVTVIFKEGNEPDVACNVISCTLHNVIVTSKVTSRAMHATHTCWGYFSRYFKCPSCITTL